MFHKQLLLLSNKASEDTKMAKLIISLSEDTGDSWFDKLNDTEQKQYVTEHPNSKYVKLARKVTEHKEKVVHKTKTSVAQIVKDQKEFFHGKGHEPGSKPRRAMGDFLKAKLHGVIKGLKHEAHEVKAAGGALVDIAKGNKINDHQKKALKSVLIHSLLVVGPMALTGGLSAGLSHVLPHMAGGFIEHTLLMSAGKAAIFASDTNDLSPEKLMKQMIDKFADYVANADIDKASWESAFESSKKGAPDDGI